MSKRTLFVVGNCALCGREIPTEEALKSIFHPIAGREDIFWCCDCAAGRPPKTTRPASEVSEKRLCTWCGERPATRLTFKRDNSLFSWEMISILNNYDSGEDKKRYVVTAFCNQGCLTLNVDHDIARTQQDNRDDD